MRATMRQAGADMLITSRLRWVDRLIAEACADALVLGQDDPDPDLHLVVEDRRDPFATRGWRVLTRGAFERGGEVVLENACGSGFDLRVSVEGQVPTPKIRVQARYRPPGRDRLAAHALPARFHLLARDVLLQYPALWLASTRGRTVLHAAAVEVAGTTVLLAGPGGVGRSTLLLDALNDGAVACSDNLSVSDGQVVHGLVEPVRIEGVAGRRMPHGRGECPLVGRVDSLIPEQLIVLRRGTGPTSLRPISGHRAAEDLVAGTCMAGELRRYWAFAATLAQGTGHGPALPRIAETAKAFSRLPCSAIVLGGRPGPSLAELVARTSAVPS